MCDWNVTHKKYQKNCFSILFSLYFLHLYCFWYVLGFLKQSVWGSLNSPIATLLAISTSQRLSIVSYTALFLSPLCCHSNWVWVRVFHCVVCITKLLFHSFCMSVSLKSFTYSHLSSLFKSTLSDHSTYSLRPTPA